MQYRQELNTLLQSAGQDPDALGDLMEACLDTALRAGLRLNNVVLDQHQFESASMDLLYRLTDSLERLGLQARPARIHALAEMH